MGPERQLLRKQFRFFLFNQAQTRDEFREMNSIDISLLKTVKRLCGDLEVKKCTAKQWRMAIYKGYEVFRALRDNRGGTVSLDLDAASISYTSPNHQKRKDKKNARNTSDGLPKRVARRR